MNPLSFLNIANTRARLEDKWEGEVVGFDTRLAHLVIEGDGAVGMAGVGEAPDDDVPEEDVGGGGGGEDGKSVVHVV